MKKNTRKPGAQRVCHSEYNIERITGRITEKTYSLVLSIGIGINICNRCDMVIGDRINIFHHKRNGNFLLLKKSLDYDGIKLWAPPNTRFINLAFSCNPLHLKDFDIEKGTQYLEYDINDEKMILVNLQNIRKQK